MFTYLHHTDILSSWQHIDIVFEFHHHFDHFHHVVVDLILRAVQFCCWSWLLTTGNLSINASDNMSGDSLESLMTVRISRTYSTGLHNLVVRFITQHKQ